MVLIGFVRNDRHALFGIVDVYKGDYKDGYDYVLKVFIRSKTEGYNQSLSKNSAYIEKILFILFIKWV